MITKIEQALISINSDKFAKICRMFLSYQYTSVMATGSVLAKEKSRKGTPDIFIPTDEGYIMCEVTTQEDRLEKKLKHDIDHCIGQKGIPLEKILKIILICNSKIKPELYETVQQYKNDVAPMIRMDIIDVDDFATRIYKNYHSIIRELGIPIDTNQIFEPAEFVHQYDRSGFTISLTNQFYNRDAELAIALQGFEEKKIIVLTGDPGTGKTKLSLRVVEEFRSSHPEYRVKYIASNGNLNIWDDLATHLQRDTDYLLVLDDANKLQSNLELILNFKKHFEKDIRVMMTVRTYVAQQIISGLEDYLKVEVKNFTHGELQHILSSPEFDISKPFIDRIYSISKGNPRLAIMCVRAGIDQGAAALQNASLIYEKYFSGMLENIGGLLQNKEQLKVAGIVSLMRTINLNNADQSDELHEYFGLDATALKQGCIELQRVEILEEHENMYKISDQILGEYIFHKVFIQDKLLPFSKLIELSFDRRRFGLLHVLTPIINNYGFEDVRLKVIADMEKYWNSLSCEETKMRFAKDFWFYLPSRTLVFLKSEISKMANGNYNDFRFEIYNEKHIKSYEDHILETLVNFKRLPEKFSQAQELLLTYGLKSNELFSKYLKALAQSFTFDNDSEHTDYDAQAKVLDFLFSKVPLDPVFYSRIILFITPEYLKSSYQTFRTVGSQFYVTDRGVYLTATYKALRTKLVGFMIECFSNKSLKFYVYDCLQAYMNNISSFRTYAKAIIFDRTQLMHFFQEHFSPKEYTDCFLVHLYGERLKYAGIRFDKRFSSKFMAPRYVLYLKLNEEYHKLKEYKGDYENYEKYKYAELGRLIKKYSFSDYLRLFSDIQFILTEGKRFVRDAPIKDSISYILDILAQKDPELFYRCLKKIFSFGFAKELELYRMFRRFKFSKDSSERIREILEKSQVGSFYLTNFWFSLPSELFTKKDITLLKRHVADGSFSYTGNLDIILPKATGLYKDYRVEIGRIIDVLTERSMGNQHISTHAPFFQYIESNYNEVFRQKLTKLQSLYLYFDRNDHFDYDLEVFCLLLRYDVTFIYRYLDENFDRQSYYTKKQIRDSYLHKLWKTDSDTDFLFKVILEHFKDHLPFSSSYSSEVTAVFKGN
ncbi:MAG: hypothetical protein E2604_13210, partial [Flavobacterium sp.]|nr:hypothetical protein [Flavobacterium sp.]